MDPIMNRVICLTLISLGCIAMVITTVRYHKHIQYNRKEIYYDRIAWRGPETLAQITLLFFVAGYLVGAADVLRRDVEPIYVFVCLVFFVGGVFIAALVHIQIGMTQALREKTMEVMRSFVTSIEMKDPYTQGHSWHVYHIVKAFYGYFPQKLRQELNEPRLLDAALLHDIGKMGVPDEILKKPGQLTEAEWRAIREHPNQGAQMLDGTGFAAIGPWVRYHHERIDGRGYHGLVGEDIPLESRIIAIADTYSAVTTDRGYRARRSHSEAINLLRTVAGTQLDAGLVELFCGIEEEELEALGRLVFSAVPGAP